VDSTAFVPFGDLRRPQAPRQRHGLWTRHPLPLALTLRALSDIGKEIVGLESRGHGKAIGAAYPI
jgi:hypothetical protein